MQDVLVVNCSKEFLANNHVLATCRTALKKQGVVGLNMAPCMKAFLERLPVMLQEQYVYEKVLGIPGSSLSRVGNYTIKKLGGLLLTWVLLLFGVNFNVVLYVEVHFGITKMNLKYHYFDTFNHKN